jgi:hypothetical protein
MSRGVGTVILNHVMNLAKAAGVRLQAEFISNDRNRVMNITYKFSGFRQVGKNGEITLLENDLARIQPFPPYIELRTGD